MNNPDNSRKKTKIKSRNSTIIAIIVIIIVIALLALVGRSMFNGNDNEPSPVPTQSEADQGSNDDKTKEEKASEETESNEDIEAARKEKYGKFYVPLPQDKDQVGELKVKGLYLNHNNVHLDFSEENIKNYEEYVKYVLGQVEDYPDQAENANVLEQMLAICNATEANAIVIDIKTDDGLLTWQSDVEIVKELDTDADTDMFNYERLLSYMDENDITPIARIVTFKDSFLPMRLPEHGMKMNNGENYQDAIGTGWSDQTDKFVWDYVLAIAKEAAYRGFEGIHFDYIRYPEATSEHVQLDEEGNPVERDEVITSFLQYAQEELDPYGVEVGAAVFGIITSTWEDEPEDIGQTWIKMSPHLDAISPMVYPSHYSTGWYGFEKPDFEPYGMFKGAMTDAYEKNSAVENPGKIRPWIQGFTADYMDEYAIYDGKMIADQVRASYELGIDEYIIWNALNEFDPEIFKYTQSFEVQGPIEFSDLGEYGYEEVVAEEEGNYSVVDMLDRSPYDTIRMFLDSIQNGNDGRVFLIIQRDARPSTYEEFQGHEIMNLDFEYYILDGIEQNEDHFIFHMILVDQDENASQVQIKLVLEDSMFKIGDFSEDGPVDLAEPAQEDESDPSQAEQGQDSQEVFNETNDTEDNAGEIEDSQNADDSANE